MEQNNTQEIRAQLAKVRPYSMDVENKHYSGYTYTLYHEGMELKLSANVLFPSLGLEDKQGKVWMSQVMDVVIVVETMLEGKGKVKLRDIRKVVQDLKPGK